jgi:hypothetical protein
MSTTIKSSTASQPPPGPSSRQQLLCIQNIGQQDQSEPQPGRSGDMDSHSLPFNGFVLKQWLFPNSTSSSCMYIYICMYIPMIWNGHELLVLPHFRNKGYPSVAQVWAQRFRLIRWLGVKKLQTMVFSMTQGGILPRFSWIVWCFEELWRDKSCMTKSSKTKPSEVPTFIQVVFY